MENISKKLQTKLKELPDTPGVYVFLDSKGEILYIGKAKRLKRRVMSYFRRGSVHDARKEMMISEICDINITRTSSEAEAFIYEAGLIKDHSPRYNIDLKDDKSYPYLKLTVNEEYPRIFSTRKRINDGAVYYGPYTSANLLKKAVSFMKRVFPLRTCRALKKKVCLEYHIGQCIGICEKKDMKDEYARIVGQLKAFLEGRKKDLIDSLKKEMEDCSKSRDFEKALSAKRRIEALTAVQQLHRGSQNPMFGELEELQNLLGLKKVPVVMECFDISNTAGMQPVGSMVRFVDGKPEKKGYRKFKVRDVKGIDDYSMIREVVRRRYKRLIDEGRDLPDLIIIDGGSGHLHSAHAELKDLGLADVEIVSIAKEFNHLYSIGKSTPVRLSPGSRVLFLIQRIRDEAHRLAITFHRSLRSKNSLKSGLREIEGIGSESEKKLLDAFGVLANIRKASADELVRSGLNKKQAENVIAYFRP